MVAELAFNLAELAKVAVDLVLDDIETKQFHLIGSSGAVNQLSPRFSSHCPPCSRPSRTSLTGGLRVIHVEPRASCRKPAQTRKFSKKYGATPEEETKAATNELDEVEIDLDDWSRSSVGRTRKMSRPQRSFAQRWRRRGRYTRDGPRRSALEGARDQKRPLNQCKRNR